MSVDYSKKNNVVKEIAELSGLSQADVGKVLNSYQDVVYASLEAENPVNLIGFGKYIVRDRKARKGRNPQTGEEIQIPAGKTYGFKFSDAFLKPLKENQK